jgi:crotonobetainyl-CoA:carnitine CoA-transferase CaiB-like acyl-CoA transferase
MPFRHLTVVDIATLGAAPQIAAFFGDFGAGVIKIEHPRGDSLRRLVDRRGIALPWKLVNRNKQCVTLDLARPAGRALLDRILARADLQQSVHRGKRNAGLVERHCDLANPHFRARGNLVEVADDEAGCITTSAPSPIGFSAPGRIRHLGRGLGADNRAVYCDWLGLDEKEMKRLVDEGVV